MAGHTLVNASPHAHPIALLAVRPALLAVRPRHSTTPAMWLMRRHIFEVLFARILPAAAPTICRPVRLPSPHLLSVQAHPVLRTSALSATRSACAASVRLLLMPLLEFHRLSRLTEAALQGCCISDDLLGLPPTVMPAKPLPGSEPHLAKRETDRLVTSAAPPLRTATRYKVCG